MYESVEDALIEALKNERERAQVVEIVKMIRKIGGEETILKLAGCILMTPKGAA